MSDIHEERQFVSQCLQTLTTEEFHSLDLQLTLIRTAFESYKRETVFKPCPSFLLGLTDEQLVSEISLQIFNSILFSSDMSFVFHLSWHSHPC